MNSVVAIVSGIIASVVVMKKRCFRIMAFSIGMIVRLPFGRPFLFIYIYESFFIEKVIGLLKNR